MTKSKRKTTLFVKFLTGGRGAVFCSRGNSNENLKRLKITEISVIPHETEDDVSKNDVTSWAVRGKRVGSRETIFADVLPHGAVEVHVPLCV